MGEIITIPKIISPDELRELDLQPGQKVKDETVVRKEEEMPIITIVELRDIDMSDGFEYICGGALRSLYNSILVIGYCCRADIEGVIHQRANTYFPPNRSLRAHSDMIMVDMSTGQSMPVSESGGWLGEIARRSKATLDAEILANEERYLQLLEVINN